MAEKRTKADKLLLNIERLEKLEDASDEPEVSDLMPEPIITTRDPGQIEVQIRLRAYELFEARGYEHGHDREDWLQAEAEILAARQSEIDLQQSKVALRQAASAA